MNLAEIKLKAKKPINTIINTVAWATPMTAIAKYVYDYYKLRQTFATNQAALVQMEQIQQRINNIPATSEGLAQATKDGTMSQQDSALFDAQRAIAKTNGPSESFLSEHGFDSVDDMYDTLDVLHAQGLAGDVGAKDTFNKIMVDYEDDICAQAHDAVCQMYMQEIGNIDIPTFDISFPDYMAVADTQMTIIFLGAILVMGINFGDLAIKKLIKHFKKDKEAECVNEL